MEKFLLETIEEKIQNLEKTQLAKIEEMKKEQKLDKAYIQLNKNKEQALEEIKNNGVGSKEASADLEKIEKELEKVKIAEYNIVKKVKREISVTKGYLTEINNIVSEKEKAQKENENIEKDIKNLTKHKEEALAEINNHGGGYKEASADLEKIEAELKNKNEIRDKNKEIIEQADKKIDKFKQRSDIKKILEEKINKDWDAAIKENEDFDKKHNRSGLDGNEQDDGQGQNRDKDKDKDKDKNTKYDMILDISGNEINITGKDKLFCKAELKNKDKIKEEYRFDSYFKNNEKAEKLVDYALISALESIDNEEKSIVNAYLRIIRDGKSQDEDTKKEVKECLEKINNAVDITYKFNKENGIFANWKEKRIARYAKKMGIASLEGISEKSIFEKIKGKFKRNKDTVAFEKNEKPKALVSGEKTEEKEKRDVHSMYEVSDDVKQNIDKVSKKYSEQEKEEEKHRAEEVEKIQNEDDAKRLQPDEYEVIEPSNNGSSR